MCMYIMKWLWVTWRWTAPFLVLMLAAIPWADTVCQRVNVAGVILQVFGILAVLVQIEKTRKGCKQPTLIARFRTWFGRRPFASRRVVAGSASCTVSAPTARGSAVGSHALTLESLAKDVQDLRGQLAQEVEARKSADEDERRAREAGDKTNRSEAEALATGGLHIAEAGAWWLLVGFLASAVCSLVE